MQLKRPETEPEPGAVLGVPEFVEGPVSLKKKATAVKTFFIRGESMSVD